MNKERLLEIADWIESGESKNGVDTYNQSVWRNENICGTACCIAGTAVAWWGKPPPYIKISVSDILNYSRDYINGGAEALGLSERDAIDLFVGHSSAPNCARIGNTRNIRPGYAARVIRHFVNTGEVNWKNPACPQPE